MENKDDIDFDLNKFIEEMSSNTNNLEPIESLISSKQILSAMGDFTYDVLQNLTAREERIIRMLYGYGLNHSFKIHEIAKQFDLPEPELRQQALTACRRFTKNYFLKLIDMRAKR